MVKINTTLLSALFVSPNPQPDRKEVGTIYGALFNRIFPAKAAFVDFLTAQTIDKQYEYASQIIQALCLFSNFPPTAGAIQDVLSLEQLQKQYYGSKSSFVPRDHYLHVVNLYLLGIYIFFYNAEFYDRLCSIMSFERQVSTSDNARMEGVKDFISSWKYFCLFHDVGYSAEVISQERFDDSRSSLLKELKRQNSRFNFAFNSKQSYYEVVVQSSTEIVSRIIAAKYFIVPTDDYGTKKKKILKRIDTASFKTIDPKSNSIIDYPRDMLLTEDVMSMRIIKIKSNHCIKFILPIINDLSVQVLGVHKRSGKIAFVSCCHNNERTLAIESSFLNNDELLCLAKNPKLLFHDDYSLSDYELEYFVKNSNPMDSIKKWIVSFDYLDSVYEYSKNSLMSRFLAINSEESFMDFQLSVYSWVKDFLDCYFSGSKLQKHLFAWNKSIAENAENVLQFNSTTEMLIVESIQVSSDDAIYEMCEEFLFRSLKSNYSKPDSAESIEVIIAKYVDNFLYALRQVASDSEDSFPVLLHREVCQELFEQFDTKARLLRIFSNVFKSLSLMFKQESFVYNYEYSIANCSVNAFMDTCISERVKGVFGFAPATLIEFYHPRFGLRIDHGIASSMYASSIFNAYQAVINSSKKDEELQLLAILFNVIGSFSDKKTKYIEDYEHVFRETILAIFSHNLYPSNFDEQCGLKNYSFELKDTFLYFSMICDFLQQWNRPHSITPAALIDKPNNDASEDYNIIVRENAILLSDGNDSAVRNRVEKLISEAASYLKDADAMLKELK